MMKFYENVDTSWFGWTDFTVVILMLFISSLIGVYYACKDKKSKTNRDFLTANRSLHWFPVSMSLMASFQSSVTILGYPAEMYLRGTQFWLVILSSVMATVAAAELYLPVYYDLNFSSINQYLKMRFNSDKVRLVASITFLCATIPYMGVVLYGPSLALSSVTPLSTAKSIFLIGIICTFYTSIGGIKAVVWTDTIQVVLMYGGLFSIMFRGFYLVGGIGEAFRIANERGRIQFFNTNIDLYSTNNLWNCVLGMGIMWCGNYCTTQTEVARYCNVTKKSKSRLALYVNLIGVISIISCACLCGIALFAFYADCDPLKRKAIFAPDQLMPYFVMETLSMYPGLAGLFVCCVFSASLSTLSSGFNALAVITWDDLLSNTKLSKLSNTKIKIISKFCAAFYGLLSIGMAFFAGMIGSVLKAAISLAGALSGPLFGTYLLGIICPFSNAFGVLVGLFVGEAFGLTILYDTITSLRSTYQLPTSIEGCDFYNSTNSRISNFTLNLQNSVIEQHEHNDDVFAFRIYKISFLLVPVFGFSISFVLGIIFSLLSGGLRKINEINPIYLSPIAWYIWPKCCVPITKRDDYSTKNSNLKKEPENELVSSIKKLKQEIHFDNNKF